MPVFRKLPKQLRRRLRGNPTATPPNYPFISRQTSFSPTGGGTARTFSLPQCYDTATGAWPSGTLALVLITIANGGGRPTPAGGWAHVPSNPSSFGVTYVGYKFLDGTETTGSYNTLNGNYLAIQAYIVDPRVYFPGQAPEGVAAASSDPPAITPSWGGDGNTLVVVLGTFAGTNQGTAKVASGSSGFSTVYSTIIYSQIANISSSPICDQWEIGDASTTIDPSAWTVTTGLSDTITIGFRPPTNTVSGNSIAVNVSAVADRLTRTTPAPIVVIGSFDTAPLQTNSAIPVVVQTTVQPVITPAITSRGSLVDVFFAPFVPYNVSQAIARPFAQNNPAPIVVRGTQDVFFAPFVPYVASQATTLIPQVMAPVVVRGGVDVVVATATPGPFTSLPADLRPRVTPAIVVIGTQDGLVTASPKPVVVSQAVASPFGVSTPAPIVKFGTQDVFFAPFAPYNISQAVASYLVPQVATPTAIRGGVDIVVPLATPGPFTALQVEVRPKITPAIVVIGSQDGLVTATPGPIVSLQAVQRPALQVNFTPIRFAGTADVPVAPFVPTVISQAIQSSLIPQVSPPVVIKGGFDVVVVFTSSPAPVFVGTNYIPPTFAAITSRGSPDAAPAIVISAPGGYPWYYDKKTKKRIIPHPDQVLPPEEIEKLPLKARRKAQNEVAVSVVISTPFTPPLSSPPVFGTVPTVTSQYIEAWFDGSVRAEVLAEDHLNSLVQGSLEDFQRTESVAEEVLGAEAKRLDEQRKKNEKEEEEFLINFAWSTYLGS